WIVLIGEFIAGLGLWLGILGNLEFMQKYVPSDFMKSVILFIGLLAGVLVGPMAGRVIDQYEKKKVLLYAGFGRVLSVIFMFFAIQFESIAFMIAFMVALQISAAFYFPALQSVIPLIVREHELLQMNGVHMNVGTIARIAGTSLGGILLLGVVDFLSSNCRKKVERNNKAYAAIEKAYMYCKLITTKRIPPSEVPALQSVIPLIVREHELLQMNGV
ncbi:MFS transporter, partial [Bacillus sp. HC-Mk]